MEYRMNYSNAVTWINIKNITLPESNLTQIMHIVRFHLYDVLEQAKLIYSGKKNKKTKNRSYLRGEA